MKVKKMLFRVDAGGSTGLGHFYRSLNLANELKKRGHTIEFIHKSSGFWDDQNNFGFEHACLRSDQENEETWKILWEGKFDIYYVDGILEFEEKSFNKIRELVKVVFYQNTSSSRYLSDTFILPSIHHKPDFFDVFDSKTKIFQGLEYFTFNQNITDLDVKKLEDSQEVKEIGIASGGSDPENVLVRLYGLIDHSRFAPVQFKYFFGVNYMHKNTLPSTYLSNISFIPYDPRVIIHTDLLLSTFGVSTYEFMYLGMPILSLGHQEANTIASRVLAEKTKAIFHLGGIREIKASALNAHLDCFIKEGTKREDLIKSSRRIIDLEGVSRVINILENE